MLVDMVDCVFADVAQPDQGRIMAINCKWFLKNGGHFVISIKVCFGSVVELFTRLIVLIPQIQQK